MDLRDGEDQMAVAIKPGARRVDTPEGLPSRMPRMIDLFVARQPIFDARDQLQAYELLYRSNAVDNRAGGVSATQMMTDTMVTAVLGIGLDKLTMGKRAFVNFNREFIVEGQWELFEPGSIVVEVLETVDPDEQVVAQCRKMVERGYAVALDDFEYEPRWEPLLALAEIIKVDVLNKTPEQLAEAATRLKPYKARLLAERVENREVHDLCAALGFTLFQGYFYAKPEIVTKKELSVGVVQTMKLMNLLRDGAAPDGKIEEEFKKDPALTYKLLKLVNSAALGGRGVQSIGYALRLIGRAPLHRWMSLILVSTLGSGTGTDMELVRSALLRARFCELVAERTHREAAEGPLFMVGLFSRLDALMHTSMQDIISHVALATEVRDALLRLGGPYARALEMLERYEDGDWEGATTLAAKESLAPEALVEIYAEALGWVRSRVQELDLAA